MTTPSPGWYADHANPALLRWWDGYQWTQYTQPGQQQPYAQQPQQQPYQQVQQQPVQPQQQQHQPPSAAPAAAGQPGVGPMFTEPSLLIAQDKRSFGIFEAAAYQVLAQSGHPIGSIHQLKLEGAAAQQRTFSNDPQSGMGLSEHFEFRDASGAVVLHLARALRANSAHRPRFDVTFPDGRPLGVIESEKLVGRITFGFTVGGARVAGVKAEGMRNRKFVLTDQAGQPFAQYDRRPPSGDYDDTYAITRHRPTPEPLGTFVLAAAIVLDAAFFVSSRGGPLR